MLFYVIYLLTLVTYYVNKTEHFEKKKNNNKINKKIFFSITSKNHVE